MRSNRTIRLVFSSLFVGSMLAAPALLLYPRPVMAEFPKPSIYPVAWELKFEHATPKRIVVDLPGSTLPQAFWYLTYTVTNNTDKEQSFLPSFELLSADGQVTPSDQKVPQKVFDAIKTRERRKFLQPSTSVAGQIRIGEAEAIDSVAIWPETTPRMGNFSIFVSGLSGEFVTLKTIDGKLTAVDKAEDLKDPKALVIMRKTLQLNFLVRGDEVYPGEDLVTALGQEWIMR